MPTGEHLILSQARKILGQVTDVFASIQQQGSVKHKSAFRIELLKHLEMVPSVSRCLFTAYIIFNNSGTEGVGDLLAEVTLGPISKSAEEGLRTKLVTTQVLLPALCY